MRRLSIRNVFCAALAAVLLFCQQSLAELTVTQRAFNGGRLTVFQLSVTPAGESNPPLKHRLRVSELELRPGNAATYYLRAFPEGGLEARVRRMHKEHGDESLVWHNAEKVPLNKLPLAKVATAASSFDYMVDAFIRPATLCRDVDWGLGIEDYEGVDIFTVPLPGIQASRSMGRVLMLRTRVAIARGDYASAIEEMRMTYRLAHNVANEPLMVCALVGIAEAAMANQGVIELIGAKGSPNLYWALTELPDPIVDTRRALRLETSLGLRVFPFLRDAESFDRSPEEWSRLLLDAAEDVQKLMAFNRPLLPGSTKTAKQASLAGLALLQYPVAKQRLLDSGMEAARVEAMPVGQVLAVDAGREYRSLVQQVEKWSYIPYHVARHGDGGEIPHARGVEALSRGYGYHLAQLLMPAIQAVRQAEVRLSWQIRALRIVEAIRMHAANTGALPDSLEAIKVVPLPVNPATNGPYEYRLEGKTGILDLPRSDGFAAAAWRFEITLAGDE